MLEGLEGPKVGLEQILLDGSFGEGGGQIIRSALALSLVTGKPFKIEKIRANREKPGLRAQHLTCVEAASRVGGAYVEGAKIGSEGLYFSPNTLQAGEYHLAIGTAGSTVLVAQTLIPALLLAGKESKLVIEGGTHNLKAPSVEFFLDVFIPALNKMGGEVTVTVDRYGFFPKGGGEITVKVKPSSLKPLFLYHRGQLKGHAAKALVVGLPRGIAEREIKTIGKEMGWPKTAYIIEEKTDRFVRGNVLTLSSAFENITEVTTSLGEIGRLAEEVAKRGATEHRRYLKSLVPVGTHLADQLLLPMALGGGGSFITGELSLHALTNIAIIQKFLDVEIYSEQVTPSSFKITVIRKPELRN